MMMMFRTSVDYFVMIFLLVMKGLGQSQKVPHSEDMKTADVD